MKGILKLIIIIAILIGIFGVANVQKWANLGINAVDRGVSAVKQNDNIKNMLPSFK